MSDRQPPVDTWKEIGMPVLKVFGVLAVVAVIVVLIIKLTKPKSSDPPKSDPNSNPPNSDPNSNPPKSDPSKPKPNSNSEKKCVMKDENDGTCAGDDLSVNEQDECYNYMIKHKMMNEGKCDHLKSLTKSSDCKNEYKKLYEKLVKDGVCEADNKKHDNLTCGQKLNQYQQLHPNACDEFSQAYNSKSQINDIDVKQCYHDALLKNQHNFKGKDVDETTKACIEQCSSSTFGVPPCRTLCTSICRGL